MHTTKLGLRDLAIPAKVQLAQQIVTAMTGNQSFTTPNPPLTTVSAAASLLAQQYNAAQAAREDAKLATLQQDNADTNFNNVLTQLAAYVDATAGGNEVVIMSSGMGVKSPKTPPVPPVAPAAVTAANTIMTGEIDLKWDRVTGAKTYAIERSPEPVTAQSWTNGDSATKARATVSNLTAGQKYWFRVAAIGAAGHGPWSNPVAKIVT
jgi:hypothetical protein